MEGTVFVAMSGGVDSSVAALLLKEKGYNVVGVTMQIWPQVEEDGKSCCSLDAVNDARRVAWKLGIPHYVMNFRPEFADKVIRYFCDEYIKGRTPNPCIACNRHIKFDFLLNKAKAMGAGWIATGHYARIDTDLGTGKLRLLRGLDLSKDQSYVLYNLTQEQLKHTLFPLGEMNKQKVREMASEAGLPVANKSESQEICFVEQGKYGDFVEQYAGILSSPGQIKDKTGKIVGTHRGILHYTIGQRKGLKLAMGKPVYINHLDAESNTVWVGDNEELFSTGLLARDVNYISGESFEKPMEIEAKIRYSAVPSPAIIKPVEEDKVRVDFINSQRAITPGQAVVFYQGDVVIGGGTIYKMMKRSDREVSD